MANKISFIGHSNMLRHSYAGFVEKSSFMDTVLIIQERVYKILVEMH